MEGPSEETGECEYDFVKVYKGINDYFEKNLVATKCGTLSSAKLTEVYKGDQGKSNYIVVLKVRKNFSGDITTFQVTVCM